MVKKSLISYRMGELSYVYFYPFSGTGDYQRKRSPTGVLFVLSDSLKLKAPSSIYLLGLTKNPRDRTITVSLDTTPQKIVLQHSHIGFPLFRVLCKVSSLDPINFESVYLLQAFPICSDIPDITAMIPFPWVKFHLLPGLPCHHTLNKGSLSLPHSHCPCSILSLPPQFSGSVRRLSHIFRLSPLFF